MTNILFLQFLGTNTTWRKRCWICQISPHFPTSGQKRTKSCSSKPSISTGSASIVSDRWWVTHFELSNMANLHESHKITLISPKNSSQTSQSHVWWDSTIRGRRWEFVQPSDWTRRRTRVARRWAARMARQKNLMLTRRWVSMQRRR